MSSNRWATMSKARKPEKPPAKGAKKPVSKRRALDDYETPGEATDALGQFVYLGGDILEPCAGTGRMVRALKRNYPKARIETADIKRGKDFLKRTKPFKGHVATNPPYRDGLAEAVARHALKLASGKVAMLLQSGFVWGARRANGLYLAGLKPELIVVIPWRIMFIDGDGNTIKGQFFSHCWVVWPERSKRASNTQTRIEWATPPSMTDSTFG